MSKKKDRAWFVCPQWAALLSERFADDVEAAEALQTDPRVITRLRSRTPVARSTMLRALQTYANRYDPSLPIAGMVVDTRSRAR
jgi:hypothetical protein